MSDFMSVAKAQPLLRQMLLEALLAMALADGDMADAERDIVTRVAGYLGVSGQEFQRLLDMMMAQRQFHGGSAGGQTSSASDLKKAYQALGVDESISDADLKRAYRKLMSQHHPDKLIAKGVPEDMMKLATEKAQEIQVAYDLIKKNRGTWVGNKFFWSGQALTGLGRKGAHIISSLSVDFLKGLYPAFTGLHNRLFVFG